MTKAQIPIIADLTEAQEQRFHTLDSYLKRARSHNYIIQTLTQQYHHDSSSLVATDNDGHVAAFVQPALWKLSNEDGQRAFFTARNGIAHNLILPTPSTRNQQTIVTTLLTVLTSYWQAQATTSDIVHWPNCDRWLEPLLIAHSFLLDTELAYYPPKPLAQKTTSIAPDLHTRLARPEDEQALVKLFEDELRYHQPFTPFVRVNHTILQAFRRRLARAWSGACLEMGAPLVIVVERDQEIVAMAENDLYVWHDDEEPGFLAPGRYGHISNVSVRPGQRGQGIGHVLVQAIFDAFAHVQLDGYILWYNPDNPSSSSFWKKMGFRPLWRTYQRFTMEARQQDAIDNIPTLAAKV